MDPDDPQEVAAHADSQRGDEFAPRYEVREADCRPTVRLRERLLHCNITRVPTSGIGGSNSTTDLIHTRKVAGEGAVGGEERFGPPARVKVQPPLPASGHLAVHPHSHPHPQTRAQE
jgi:hypothetical protein